MNFNITDRRDAFVRPWMFASFVVERLAGTYFPFCAIGVLNIFQPRLCIARSAYILTNILSNIPQDLKAAYSFNPPLRSFGVRFAQNCFFYRLMAVLVFCFVFITNNGFR